MANFNFGTASNPAKPSFGLGGGGLNTTGGFSFGTTTTASAPAAGGFLSTSVPNTSGFGGTIGATQPPLLGCGFGFNASMSMPKPAQQTNLSFGNTTQPTLGSTLGQPQQQSFDFGKPNNPLMTSTGISGGLFATPITSSQSAPQQSVGLGGIDINANKPKAVEGKNESGKVKESQVPQEIVSLVEHLETYIKQQKEISSEIAKPSSRKLISVESEIQKLNSILSEISNDVNNNYTNVKVLRVDTNEAIQNAEMAQRTQNISNTCLQYENTAPTYYFLNLVQKFEGELIKIREQVDLTERHMKNMTNVQKLSADDVKKGLHQIHEICISLAARIHDIHQKVEEQKSQYLNLRKIVLHDKTNVFEEIENGTTKVNSSKITSGPTPFSTLSGMNHSLNFSKSIKDTWVQSQPLQQTSGFGIQNSFGTENNLLSTGSKFGATSLTGDSGGFNLQKPPIGTKRNKH